MNPEHYKPKRNPNRSNQTKKAKRKMMARSNLFKSYTSPKLHEIYSTKIEWASKIFPKLKEK